MESNPLFEKCNEVSNLLRAISHPDRLKILCSLLEGEKPVNDLIPLCNTSQSGVSQFLARMKAENLVTCRKEGTQVFYELSHPELRKIIRALKKIYY